MSEHLDGEVMFEPLITVEGSAHWRMCSVCGENAVFLLIVGTMASHTSIAFCRPCYRKTLRIMRNEDGPTTLQRRA